MNTMEIAPLRRSSPTLSDEHNVLLWQTCSYADDLIEAVCRSRPLRVAREAMLEFAHHRLLPYLAQEERWLPPNRLRDDHLVKLLVEDHERIRRGVDNIEAGTTRQLLAFSADSLVERLDRHLRREQAWVSDDAPIPSHPLLGWPPSLRPSDESNVDALPEVWFLAHCRGKFHPQ